MKLLCTRNKTLRKNKHNPVDSFELPKDSKALSISILMFWLYIPETTIPQVELK